MFPKKVSHPVHVMCMEVVLFVFMGNRSNETRVRILTYSVDTVQPTVITKIMLCDDVI
jgi:hypothetical protein